MKRGRLWMALAPAAMLAWASAAWAVPPPDEVCVAGKEVAAGEYGECRLRAEAMFVLNDRMDDYEKAIAECDERLVEKFALLESQADGACPTVGDAAAMMALITGHTAEIVAMLGGMPITGVCGNGVLELGEECEWGNLVGASCGSATGGWLPKGDVTCNVGTCTLDTSDCFDQCAGATVDGVCWVLGEAHEPCNCVCADHWAIYDEATATVAGSLGTDEMCNTILDALGVPAGPVVPLEIPDQGDGVDYGLGCAYHQVEGTRYRVTSPATTAMATTFEWVNVARACGCHLMGW